jgi:hypothetical protein
MTDIYVIESPINMIAGETKAYTVDFLGTTAVSAPVATVYFKKADVTATVMPSGTATAAGTSATMKPLKALEQYAGTMWVWLQVTRGGNTELAGIEVKVTRQEKG